MSENLKNIDLNPSDFELVQKDQQLKDEKFQGKPIGYFQDAMLRFTRNKSAIVAAIFIVLVTFFATFGPAMNEYTYRQPHIQEGWTLMPPRIPGLEKIGIFDGTRIETVQVEQLEARFGDAVVEVIEEFNNEFRGREIPMAKVRVDVYKARGAEDVYFWFGTDSIGRDQWTRLWRGARVSLLIAFIAVMINVFIGVTYGAISGYYGGWVDMLMQRFIEIIGSIPNIIVVIMMMMVLGGGMSAFILAFIVTGWIGMSRMIRAQFYKYKGQEYVLASRTMGAKDGTLIFRHILPNAIGPIITQATLAIPSMIFLESTLSYLGLGISAPEPSIGNLLAQGQKDLTTTPHLVFFPAVLISILMLSFNMFGNGLRDAFDPTLRGQ